MPVLILAAVVYLIGQLGLEQPVTRVLQIIVSIIGLVLFVGCFFGMKLPECLGHW